MEDTTDQSRKIFCVGGGGWLFAFTSFHFIYLGETGTFENWETKTPDKLAEGRTIFSSWMGGSDFEPGKSRHQPCPSTISNANDGFHVQIGTLLLSGYHICSIEASEPHFSTDKEHVKAPQKGEVLFPLTLSSVRNVEYGGRFEDIMFSFTF